MATINDVTGDALVSKVTSEKYRLNYDQIFGKKTCESCRHHTWTDSIDDAEPICWECVSAQRTCGQAYTKWEERTVMSDGITDMHTEKLKASLIHSPAHYTDGREIEPIAVIEDWKLGYHLGNALKYISRAGRKDDYKTDLKKAVWYLNREIERGTV